MYLHETMQMAFVFFLTSWRPGYDLFVPGFQPKTSSFWLLYQRHSSSTNYTTELFKSSKDSASLLDQRSSTGVHGAPRVHHKLVTLSRYFLQKFCVNKNKLLTNQW